MTDEWRIQKDKQGCEKPGCPLAGRREYFAVLELPSCARRDLCLECFRELEAGAERPPIFWRGQRRADGKKGLVLDLATLRQMFDRLAEEPSEQARALRYLVALLLLRKRVLKMVDPRTPAEEGADLLVVDPKVEGMEPVALIAPAVELEQLVAMKDELLAAAGE
jgi:hypothetical protein